MCIRVRVVVLYRRVRDHSVESRGLSNVVVQYSCHSIEVDDQVEVRVWVCGCRWYRRHV